MEVEQIHLAGEVRTGERDERVSRHAVLTHPHPILCPYTPEGITTGQGVQSVL